MSTGHPRPLESGRAVDRPAPACYVRENSILRTSKCSPCGFIVRQKIKQRSEQSLCIMNYALCIKKRIPPSWDERIRVTTQIAHIAICRSKTLTRSDAAFCAGLRVSPNCLAAGISHLCSPLFGGGHVLFLFTAGYYIYNIIISFFCGLSSG